MSEQSSGWWGMVDNTRRNKLVRIAMVVCAAGVAGCTRHSLEAEPVRAYGSIKDDVVVKSRAPAKRYASAPVVKARQASAPAPSMPAVMTPQPSSAQPSVASAMSQSEAATKPLAGTAPPAADAPLPPVDDPSVVAKYLEEGMVLFEEGKVLQARRRFVAAMNGPVPQVMLALARSYDTYYLSRLPASDAAPDMQRALVLYERALERGAEAAADLERTRGILRIPR